MGVGCGEACSLFKGKMKRRNHIETTTGTVQKKNRGVKKSTPSKKPLRSALFHMDNVENIDHKGFRVSLIDAASKTMWKSLQGWEKDHYVSMQQQLIKNKTQKRIDVTYDFKGFPITKTIYVKYSYQGDGREFATPRGQGAGAASGAGK